MHLKKSICRSLIMAAAFLTTGFASADSFTWTFASADVSGSGTLLATAYGSPGEFLITGGSGTVTDSKYGTLAVTFYPCATPAATCTLVNTDGAGANLTYDNLLFPGNAPGGQLDDNGVVLTFAPPGTSITGLGIFDTPSQEFYAYTNNGYQNLTTPFTVTPIVATTPEPASLILVGTGIVGAYYRRKRSKAYTLSRT